MYKGTLKREGGVRKCHFIICWNSKSDNFSATSSVYVFNCFTLLRPDQSLNNAYWEDFFPNCRKKQIEVSFIIRVRRISSGHVGKKGKRFSL